MTDPAQTAAILARMKAKEENTNTAAPPPDEYRCMVVTDGRRCENQAVKGGKMCGDHMLATANEMIEMSAACGVPDIVVCPDKKTFDYLHKQARKRGRKRST